MTPTKIKNPTHILAEDQPEYLPLPIRRETMQIEGLGEAPVMVSRWKLEPDEIVALMGGAEVELRIVGTMHPPVMLSVK